jgi:pre-mRNA-splicing factor 38A
MANVTDPLARTVHGKDPQNLIEYITRQKIYDSIYWKEECFGLSASDVATKATELKALGGSYGANNKPTRFLCLTLKLLQIQPEDGIVDEFLMNEDFKYVRALGAFYLRLTGRPAEIYEQIEPMYNDFRKLRFRTPTGWTITHIDEFADELLTSDRYCGIALPHLPKRDVLVSAGYLDGPRRSALTPLIEEQSGGDAEKLLEKLAENGNAAAVVAMNERKRRKREAEEKERSFREQVIGGGRVSSEPDRSSSRSDDRGRYGQDRDERFHGRDERYESNNTDKRKKEKKDKKYGNLFKKSSKSDKEQLKAKSSKSEEGGEGDVAESVEYWNAERAKLGLKPLKED